MYRSSILFSVCQYVTLHNVHTVRADGKGAAYGCKFMECIVIFLSQWAKSFWLFNKISYYRHLKNPSLQGA